MMGKADDMEDRSRSGWNTKEGDSAGRTERLRLMLIVPMLHQGGFERVLSTGTLPMILRGSG